eukprot:3209146-Pyramimonas_sp.AAC.1
MSSRLGSARKNSRLGKKAPCEPSLATPCGPTPCEVCKEERDELVDAEVISWAREACDQNSGDLVNFLTGAFAHP